MSEKRIAIIDDAWVSERIAARARDSLGRRWWKRGKIKRKGSRQSGWEAIQSEVAGLGH